MQRTADSLTIRVGDDKIPLTLTDSAVEAVQDEAAGDLVTALATTWAVEQRVEAGESFASLEINVLLELRDALQSALDATGVLVECRPLDDLESDDGDA